MSKFIELAVGVPFPIKNPHGGNDATVANITGQSFDIICWANNLRSKEVQAWKRGTLRYGVYVRGSIPFFLLYFPDLKWSLDVSINILAEKEKERPYQDYLDGAGNAVHLFLVDAATNNIKAMRMIGIEHDLADNARTACRDQLTVYSSSDMLNQHLGHILDQVSTDRMIQAVSMVELRR
jgi:hypothetical protein